MHLPCSSFANYHTYDNLSFCLSNSYATHRWTLFFFFLNNRAPPEISPLPLHAALPIFSFVKTPSPSTSCRGRPTSASPRVLMPTISAAPPRSASRSRPHPACHSASLLPRVPSFRMP